MLIDITLRNSKGHMVGWLGLDGGLMLERNVFPGMPIFMPHREYATSFIEILASGGLPAGAFSPGVPAIFGLTRLELEMRDICL